MLQRKKLLPLSPPTRGQRILFTGPAGIGNHRARLIDDHHYIGEGPMSVEGTGDLNYLYRAASYAPPPIPKQCYVGAVGWGMQYNQLLNSRTIRSNMQIKKAEILSALEDRVTHRYQNPWHVPPNYLDKQSVGTRGKLAWTHIYDSYCMDNNKQFSLNKREEYAKRKRERVLVPIKTRAVE